MKFCYLLQRVLHRNPCFHRMPPHHCPSALSLLFHSMFILYFIFLSHRLLISPKRLFFIFLFAFTSSLFLSLFSPLLQLFFFHHCRLGFPPSTVMHRIQFTHSYWIGYDCWCFCYYILVNCVGCSLV